MAINTKAIEGPSFITKAAKVFGSQCIIVSIDVKEVDSAYRVMLDGGRNDTGMDPADWAKKLPNTAQEDLS